MCYFYDLGRNIYCVKIMGHYFLGNPRMTIRKDLLRNARGLILVLSRYLFGGTGENRNNLSQGSQSPGRYLNPGPVK